jgi:hypothetical protein
MLRPRTAIASALLRRLDGVSHTAVPVSNMMPVEIDTHFDGNEQLLLSKTVG